MVQAQIVQLPPSMTVHLNTKYNTRGLVGGSAFMLSLYSRAGVGIKCEPRTCELMKCEPACEPWFALYHCAVVITTLSDNKEMA